jgi:hypothetical protein
MFIRQQCLYSFEDALKLQPASRLEEIMVTLDLQGVMENIPWDIALSLQNWISSI